MNRQLKGLCLVAMFVLGISVQIDGRCDVDEPSFSATVQENFPKWDLNHDGILSGEEVLKAFRNPGVKGPAAAAIVVFMNIERKHSGHLQPLESFTLEQAVNLQQRHDDKGFKGNPQKTFKSSLKKINDAAPQLFAHDLPHIEYLVQNGANDCYFLSVVGALAGARPQDLVKMIEPTDDGSSYTIHFFGTEPIKIATPTAAEISAFNTDSGDGLWFPVLLKAFGKYKLSKHWKNMAPRNEVDPIEAAAIPGGMSEPIVNLLTGRAVRTFKPKEVERDLRHKFLMASAEHRLVLCGVPKHALAVTGYDKDADEVQIWNPWGTSGMYKTLDAKMDHGTLTIPTSVFIEKCTHVIFEQSRPADFNSPHPNHPLGARQKRHK